MTNAVHFHRIIRAPCAKVYRAFLDAEALVKWIPPHGFTAKVHHLEAKVGGTFRMSFTNFTTQESSAFGGTYLEMVADERLRYTDQFDNTKLPGTMITTVNLKAVSCGTELTISQEGIPAMIPVEMCYLGWQDSLNLLTLLVEPNIPKG